MHTINRKFNMAAPLAQPQCSRKLCRRAVARIVACVMLLLAPVPGVFGAKAGSRAESTLRDRWTSCLKEYVRHTSYEKYYLKEIDSINSANTDSVLPSQLAASYYPMCRLFTERGEFLTEVLFARQVFNDMKKQSAKPADFHIMAKYANSAGLSYTALKFYDEAQDIFEQGTAIARKHGFDKVLSQIYTNRAQLYYDTGDYAKALDLLSRFMKIAGESGSLYSNMALVCSGMNQHDKALRYFDKALRLAAGDDVLQARIYTNKASLLIETERYSEAERCLVLADRLYRGDNSTVVGLLIRLNFVQLRIAMGQKRRAFAEMERIEKHVMPGLSDAIKGIYLKEIAGLYMQLADYVRASRCLQESIKLNDSLNNDSQKRQLFQMMAWYDIAQLRSDNMELKMKYELASIKLRNRTIATVATILVALLLSVLAVVAVKKRRNEQRQSAIILEQEKKLRMLEQKEHEWEKKRMESEIGKKSRELTIFSIDLSSIDNLHKNICEELTELNKDIAEEDTRKRVSAISLKLRQQTASRLNEGFKTYFNEVSPMFDARLKEAHPNLTQNDCRLCAYIYMGLTSKEISQITFREVESVEKSRNRLRKKINLGSDVPIRTYLSSIVGE